MNPLAAMAKAIYESVHPGEKWEDATVSERAVAFTHARAARDALADNVSEGMINALEDRRHDLAAAILAAGEE